MRTIQNFINNIKKWLAIQKRKKELSKMGGMPSLLTSNCVSGVIYHDLGQRFLSPTVNLYLKASDFLTFVENLSMYCDNPTLIECEDEKLQFPIGVLKKEGLPDLKVFFMHYHNFSKAKEKWLERCQRIDYSNIVIVFDLVKEKEEVANLLNRFNKLPYKKVALVREDYKEYENTFVFTKEMFDDNSDMTLLTYKTGNKWMYWRYLDYFDYVTFINTGKIQKRNLK